MIETEDSPSSNYSAGQRTSSKFPFLHFAEEYQGLRLVSNKLFFAIYELKGCMRGPNNLSIDYCQFVMLSIFPIQILEK